MDNVTLIKASIDIPTALRNIADGIESGDFVGDNCTVIIGKDVFHSGDFNEALAIVNAVWNMTFGIHKLMAAFSDTKD